jgi:hypothetical protein
MNPDSLFAIPPEDEVERVDEPSRGNIQASAGLVPAATDVWSTGEEALEAGAGRQLSDRRSPPAEFAISPGVAQFIAAVNAILPEAQAHAKRNGGSVSDADLDGMMDRYKTISSLRPSGTQDPMTGPSITDGAWSQVWACRAAWGGAEHSSRQDDGHPPVRRRSLHVLGGRHHASGERAHQHGARF